MNGMGDIGLAHFLALAGVLFSIGALGAFLHRKNLIAVLMAIELMLLAANINFVAFSAFQGNLTGQVFAMIALAIAAAEAAVGLALLVAMYRHRRSIDVDAMQTLKE